ncbi:DEAD/DEAH box helicase [Prosthecobacter algae]|uniref:DEAD/DEAH box helicase n=1 Tax=Prosthecobacter algae TaxID=1144682 RepID=UPI0031F0137C
MAAWDGVAGADYALSQNARKLLHVLLRKADEDSAARAAVVAVQHEIAGLGVCLEMAMEAGGVARELLDFRAVQLGAPEATTARMRKRVILRFPIIKPPAWARGGTEPFAVSTPLRLAYDERGSEVQIRRQSPDPFGKPVDPLFAGLDCSARSPCFLISFPADIVVADVPECVWVSPYLIPPPELAQLKELARWCIPDEAPDLISAFTKNAPGRPVTALDVVASDPALSGNPRQQAALNWMMSDAPLVLVKGPPGTGKTTVITEAVRQAIPRKQKVLICSETHQAVANVLERLHRDGSLRMVRHARPDNPRLTDLERAYLEGGTKQGFLARVRERAAAQVQACHDLRGRLAPLPKMLESAHAGAVILAARRHEIECLTQEAQEEFERTRETAERQRADQTTTLESNRDSELARIEVEAAADGRALLKAQADWRAAAERGDDAAGAYLKKTGAAPEHSGAEPGRWFDLSSLVPNMFATAALLQQRFSRAIADEQAARRQIAQYECSFAEHERNLQECRCHASTAIQEVQSASNMVLEAAQQSLRGRLQDLKHERELAESEHLPPQERAAQAWNAAGEFAPITWDNPPPVWNDRISELIHAIRRNEEKAAFCERWQQAAETSSQELTGLFWNTTQVFLSTCVGLASWRAFHEYYGKEGVDMVIVDEAAHATLAQTLIPLSRAKRAILIGDEMQLPPAPPMELGRQCENSCSARCHDVTRLPSSSQSFKPSMSSCWLERSAFEWLTETRPSVPRVVLNRQFRMHPDIADFIGHVFYQDDGGLENGVTAEARHLAFGEFTKAVCLVSTSAYQDRHEETPNDDSTSIQNPLEVDLTRRILKQARQSLGEAVTFGVVTPYAAQKVLMEQKLSEFFASGSHVTLEKNDIASVDSFQGSERDVMIASFVRSPTQCKRCRGKGISHGQRCGPCRGRGWEGPGLRWVHDLRRLNVAFSRAKRMLILVGDIESLTDHRYGTDEGAEVLSRFRKHVSDRGRVLHVWEDEHNG